MAFTNSSKDVCYFYCHNPPTKKFKIQKISCIEKKNLCETLIIIFCSAKISFICKTSKLILAFPNNKKNTILVAFKDL